MKQIPLTQGYFVMVDDADFDYLSQWKWYVYITPWNKYAVRDEKGKHFRMHHSILPRRTGYETDHINGDGLDNRRANLRYCTTAQNQWNRKKVLVGSSQYKGVYWEKTKKRWRPRIKKHGHRHALGYFKTEIEAAKKYDQAARQMFGEFAKTNFS